jgi:hypothetical protein
MRTMPSKKGMARRRPSGWRWRSRALLGRVTVWKERSWLGRQNQRAPPLPPPAAARKLEDGVVSVKNASVEGADLGAACQVPLLDDAAEVAGD